MPFSSQSKWEHSHDPYPAKRTLWFIPRNLASKFVHRIPFTPLLGATRTPFTDKEPWCLPRNTSLEKLKIMFSTFSGQVLYYNAWPTNTQPCDENSSFTLPKVNRTRPNQKKGFAILKWKHSFKQLSGCYLEMIIGWVITTSFQTWILQTYHNQGYENILHFCHLIFWPNLSFTTCDQTQRLQTALVSQLRVPCN